MEVKKRILVIGINCFPEITGIGKYTGEMVIWLAENGYTITMVTSFPYYPNWKVQKPYNGKWHKKEVYYDGRLEIYRCPIYVPVNPSGLKRLIHEATFFVSAFLIVFRLIFKSKYDLIFSIAPPFHLGFLALFYRLLKGGRIIYHIQDLQIEAAKELEMLNSWMFDMLFAFEKLILRKVNFISTISKGMLVKIQKKISKPILFFPNWVDTDVFFPISKRSELKLKWGYELTDTVLLYSGSIGEKQGLDSLIRISDQLRDINHLKFIICGTGPYKDELLRMAQSLSLKNLTFLPLQREDLFNDFLNMSDIHVVLQKGNASDLMMPSKLTTILSVGGLALVTANTGTTLCDVITSNKMGIVIPPEDELILAKTIMSIIDENLDYLRDNAREYALKYLNKENILANMLNNIKK